MLHNPNPHLCSGSSLLSLAGQGDQDQVYDEASKAGAGGEHLRPVSAAEELVEAHAE